MKKIKLKYVLAGLALLILLIGGGVGLYLNSRSQEIRQQAAGGYADCAGGVKDGEKACSGFREVVVCHNGAFAALRTCDPSEKCDKNAATGCVATALSCAGGVADGKTACADLRTQVTCTNGVFTNSVSCSPGTCTNGSCGGQAAYCDRSGPNTTQCTDKSPGAACRSTANVAGTCQVTVSGGANSECSCNPGTGAVPSPTPGTGACVGTVCTPPAGGCLAIHSCDQLDSQGNCTVLNPQVVTSVANAQQIANSTCKCVQVDVLNGQNGSCVNGHINGDFSTLIGNSNVCPNVACTPPAASPGVGGPSSPTPGSSPAPSPVASPTPGVSPSPVVSPTPGVSPSPVVSPSPSPTPVCGSTCATTSECPQDHTCNNGTCQLTACVNGATCDSSTCRVTQCGSTCTTTADCPNDHTCNDGVCRLNACLNGSSCSSDLCRVTACGSSCSANSDCPNDHTCSGGACRLTACVNGSSCDTNQCNILTPSPVPSPVLGCNDTCVNNSDCKSDTQICVDTSTGRRCRLETNITSDSCSAPGQAVAQATPQPERPAALPVAGSSDILKALGVGVLAIILGIVGFLAL